MTETVTVNAQINTKMTDVACHKQAYLLTQTKSRILWVNEGKTTYSETGFKTIGYKLVEPVKITVPASRDDAVMVVEVLGIYVQLIAVDCFELQPINITLDQEILI